MKKYIIFNIILVVSLITSIIAFAFLIPICSDNWDYYLNTLLDMPYIAQSSLDNHYNICVRETFSVVAVGFSALANIAVLVIVNLFYRVQLINWFNGAKERAAARKAKRNAAAEKQKQADKQKRIEELQSELDNLKND